jgi:hypothetical protein
VVSPVHYEKEVAMELKKLSRKGLLLVFLSVLLFSVTQQSNAQTICSNQTGTNNGFFYSFWKDTGSAYMTLGSGGNYYRRAVRLIFCGCEATPEPWRNTEGRKQLGGNQPRHQPLRLAPLREVGGSRGIRGDLFKGLRLSAPIQESRAE